MLYLDALGPSGEYRTRNREVITDMTGAMVAELSIVPPLYVSRTVRAQRQAAPLPMARRESALADAADIFETAVIGGLDFDEYVAMVSRVAGLPVTVARTSARGVAEAVRGAVDAVTPARPVGAVLDWRDERSRSGTAVWARRGDVLAVHASGNSPGVHGSWTQALALGFHAAVRPSRREPFTGHRLINALRQAGFRPEDAVYLPTDHAGAAEIVDAADLAVVYGGQDVVDKYTRDPTVLTNGPGRTKILITAEMDWRAYLDVIVESISGQGGMACTNATAVLYEGDPRALAEAIAARLATIEPLPASDERAILPTQRLTSARRIAEYLAAKSHGAEPLLGADQVVADLGDGSAALRPAVHLLERPDVDMLNTELAFPSVWIAPWCRGDGMAPLRQSLVVNAVTTDDGLIDALLAEPTVANVYAGNHLTSHTAAGIPHDGFLADFLMRTKGMIRD
ncbi:aldehyde dehydrogenase [Mycobacterium sp. 852013-50091_SCH5140682]|uniref:aldehyde dehydrogenase family protein n=1 Tax=Mycobacterium sp. 852013-50091_SCH5140682 TaxID=1834109 RepID=UPI0007EB0DB9|nr:aldehyde dehydrogenase family protein [Mycobacterium sp. 852013-50091_SCH5140682]OBC02043.1 aldehyde dehydrogenase [Mycobacterium sp. 852013-50091_SCH5140682]